MTVFKPDYNGGSIVNLMSSIMKSSGGESPYVPLKDFDIHGISRKNIVFIVIDGLGYEFLMKYGEGSFLHRHLHKKMTTVFPATTVAAITSFMSGVAPQQHALTGWFMYLKEIGAVTTIIRFTTRAGGLELQKGNIEFKDIYNERSIFDEINATSIVIQYEGYFDSEYSRLVTRGAKRLPFSTLTGFFRQIDTALKMDKQRKFVFAYWAILDSICHKTGMGSREAGEHFIELDKKIESLAKSLNNNNTVLIITADHGLIDTKEKNRIIELKDHPEFVNTLAMPLSGEPRAVYCYVRPEKIEKFEDYVKTEFKECCAMCRSEDLIRENYFGLYEPNKKLAERVGDYVLIMRENYVMKDLVLGEEPYFFTGHHGGVSKEEVFVPLVVVE